MNNIRNLNRLIEDVYIKAGIDLTCRIAFYGGKKSSVYSFSLDDYQTFAIIIDINELMNMSKDQLFYIFEHINVYTRETSKGSYQILSGENYKVEYTKLFLSFEDYLTVKQFEKLSKTLRQLQNAEIFSDWEEFTIDWKK